MACIKHFALYGGSEAGRDYNTVDMSRWRMFNYYMPPYKAAVDAGAMSVMTSFNTFEGIPSTANRWLLTDVLRGMCKLYYPPPQLLPRFGQSRHYKGAQ